MVKGKVHMCVDIIQQEPSNRYWLLGSFYCLCLTASFAENSKLSPQFPRDKH